MAEIAEGGGGGGHHKGKKRAKKSSTRVDMTPMVDLAFLLLTFFVMTSTFNKPKIMSLNYPAKLTEEEKKLLKPPKVNNAITFLVTEDAVYYYEKEFHSKANPGPNGPTVLQKTDFSATGIRKILAEKNAYVLGKKKQMDIAFKNKKLKNEKEKDKAQKEYDKELGGYQTSERAVKVLVKTDDKATCKNFIDLIDELKIAEVGVMAPLEISADELTALKEQTKK